MTYAQKHKENKRLLEGFVNFLPECTTYEQRLKLSSEIDRLNDQNKQIEQMPYEETKRDISDWKIHANAVLRDTNPIEMEKIFDLKRSLDRNPMLHHIKDALAQERKNDNRKGAIALLENAITRMENSGNPVKPLPTYRKRKIKSEI